MLFLLLSLLSLNLNTAQTCWKTSESEDGCLFCRAGFYNSFPEALPFESENCIEKKIDGSNAERTVYLAPRDFALSSDLSALIIYRSVADAMKTEDRMTASLAGRSIVLRIKVLSGHHFLLASDLEGLDAEFFLRNPLEISISPLLCSEAPLGLSDSCFMAYEFATIYVKSANFSIFVSKIFSLQNIRFNGQDLPLFYLNDACKNKLVLCCKENDPRCRLGAPSSLNPLKSGGGGLINLEPVFDDSVQTAPSLSLKNVVFDSFLLFGESDKIVGALIALYDFQGQVSVENLTISNCYFSGGFLNKLRGARAVYNLLLAHDTVLQNFTSQSSRITIKTLKLINFHRQLYFTQDSPGDGSSLFNLVNFRGQFLLEEALFSSTKLTSGCFLALNNELGISRAEVAISKSIFKSNSFNCFAEFKDFPGSAASSASISNNSLLDNYFRSFAKLSHLRNFSLSGVFEAGFALPSLAFITSFHANTYLKNCVFLDLKAPSAEYSLIKIVSIYAVSRETVFTTAKRSVYYSNESTLAQNCLFINGSYLFFNSPSINYVLSIQNAFFQDLNLLLHAKKPLIDLMAEGLFTVSNTIMKNITSYANIIAARPFLNITLSNLTLDQIYTEASDVLYLYSISVADKNQHQLNVTDLKMTNIFLKVNADSLGKVTVSAFRSISLESGKGPAVYLTNVFLENIFHERPHLKHYVLSIDNCFFLAKNVSGANISNSTFLSHNPRTGTSDLLADSLRFFNPLEFSIIKLFECGVSYFTRAQLTNSNFVAPAITFNVAGGFNLAQTLFLFNVSFELGQETGTLLYAQVTSLKTILLKNVSVKALAGGAALFTLATEQQDMTLNWDSPDFLQSNLSSGLYKAFGIIDSRFESAQGGAFILLMRTQIIFQACAFKNNSAADGSVVSLSQDGAAAFFSCKITGSYSFGSGGSFAVEGSRIILLNSTVSDSEAKYRGGALYALDSRISIRDSIINIVKSSFGGAIFADGCITELFGTKLNDSQAEQYGAHLVSKQGSLSISHSFFLEGSSFDLGGSLFIENCFFQLHNLLFKGCSAKAGTIYAVNGDPVSSNIISDLTFAECHSEITGAVLFSSDINIAIFRLAILRSTARRGFLLDITGLFTSPQITIASAHILNNTALKGLFSLTEVSFNLAFTVISKNNVEQPNFLYVVSSSVFMRGIYFNTSASSHDNFQFFLKAKSSFLVIFASTFELRRSASFALGVDCLKLVVMDSSFNQGRGLNGAIFALQHCNFFAENSVLAESSSSKGAIYAVDTGLIIRGCRFSNNYAAVEGSDLFVLGLTDKPKLAKLLKIENSYFNNVSKTSISAVLQNIFIFEVLFSGSVGGHYECGALRTLNSQVISISESLFLAFLNKSVISVSRSESGISFLSVFTSAFIDSKTPLANGAFISSLSDSQIFIYDSYFEQGRASKGGALYLVCQSRHCLTVIVSSNFSKNSAAQSGGAISSESDDLFAVNCFFEENSAYIGDDINFYPSDMIVVLPHEKQPLSREVLVSCVEKGVGDNCTFVDPSVPLRVIPGYNFSMGFVITDENKNIQLNEDKGLGIILEGQPKSNNSQSLHKFTNNIARIEQGVGIFEGITLVGETGMALDSQITYKRGKVHITKKIIILVEHCKRGDSYQDGRCKPCPENFYSLSWNPEKTNQSCQSCPDNCFCPGGFVIIPNQRFWRKDGNSSKIFKCPKKYACPMQSLEQIVSDNYRFQCANGYEGNLCDACSSGYGLLSNQCVGCESGQLIFLALVLSGFLIYLGYIYFQEKNSSNSHNHDIALVKILVNHMSVFIMLSALKVDWSDLFRDFFTVVSSYASTSPSSIFSLDCLLEWNAYQQIFNRLILAGFTPLVLTILSFVVNIVAHLIFSMKSFKISEKRRAFYFFLQLHLSLSWVFWEFLKHLILIFLNIYPQILLQMFKIFGCSSLDDTSTRFLSQHPWVICESDEHNTFLKISLFFFSIWGLIFPILIFLLLRKIKSKFIAKSKSKNFGWTSEAGSKVKTSFGTDLQQFETESIAKNKASITVFLTQGYKEQFYWWEITVFVRKLLFLSVTTFSEQMDSISIGAIAILILTFFLLITLFYRPFTAERYVVLECTSLQTSIISISMGLIMSYQNEISQGLVLISVILLIASNILFFSLWILLFSKKIANFLLPHFARRFESIRTRKSNTPLSLIMSQKPKAKVVPS